MSSAVHSAPPVPQGEPAGSSDNSAPSAEQATQKPDFPFKTYREYLDVLANYDNRFTSVAKRFADFDANRQIDSDYKPSSSIAVEESQRYQEACLFSTSPSSPNLVETVLPYLDKTGFPVGCNSHELVKRFENGIQAVDPSTTSTHVLVYVVGFVPSPKDKFGAHAFRNGAGSPFNLALLDSIGRHFDVEPENFRVHLQLDSASYVPSQSNMLCIISQASNNYLVSWTGQICSSRASPLSKLVLIMIRSHSLDGHPFSTRIPWIRNQILRYPYLVPAAHLPRIMGAWPLFLNHLRSMSKDEISAAEKDPLMWMIPCSQLSANNHLYELRWLEEEVFKSDSDQFQATNDDLNKVTVLARHNAEIARSFFRNSSTAISKAVVEDLEFVLNEYERLGQRMRERMASEVALASLHDSKTGIALNMKGLQQNMRMKRLTELAFIFIPLSLITSVFGMNIDLLSGDGARWWTVLIGIVIVFAVVTSLFWIMEHHPKFPELRVKKVPKENGVRKLIKTSQV